MHLVGSSILLYLIDDARSNKNQIIIIIIIIIIIFIYCNWVVTRRRWLFYMYTNMEKKSN